MSAYEKVERTLPMILQWDENFDIGSDTLTGVNYDDYQPPFPLMAKLDKLTIKVVQLSPRVPESHPAEDGGRGEMGPNKAWFLVNVARKSAGQWDKPSLRSQERRAIREGLSHSTYSPRPSARDRPGKYS